MFTFINTNININTNMTENINFDFESLNMKIPNLITNYPKEKQSEIYEYLSELDSHNRKAYEIALEHLGTSFNICRSNGFILWKKTKEKK